MTGKVRLTLNLSEELNKELEQIATDTGGSKTDVLKKALALMSVSHQAVRQGQHLGLVKDADKLDREIIGL